MKKYTLVLWSICLCAYTYAQTPMTLQQCDTAFVNNNLMLLAERYNIDQAEALAIQAKIWDLPELDVAANAIDPQNHQLFHVGNSGQMEASISQIIYLGGKKKNEVAWARSNIQIAQWQFTDLMRNLSYQLKSSFYQIYFIQKQLELTKNQVENLQELIRTYHTQAQKGTISIKDLTRLQSLYFEFKNNRAELQRQYVDEQAQLKLLTNHNQDIIPQADTASFTQKINALIPPIATLLDSAINHRSDYQMSISQLDAAKQYLKWQKSLAIPDVNIGASYDRQGGAFQNQINLTLGIPLPLWNRNKGNIAVAKAQLAQSDAQNNHQKTALQTEITSIYQKWLQAKDNYQKFTAIGTKDLNQVYDGVYQNFKKGNISMLEFADFMESYHQSIDNYNETLRVFILACEDLNKATQSHLF